MAASKKSPQSIKKQNDFDFLFKNGKLLRPASYFSLRFVQTTTGTFRYSVSMNRKVGNSVLRNRIKRWVREYFREGFKVGRITNTVDINILLRSQKAGFYSSLTRHEFWSHLDRCQDVWK